MEPMVAEGLTRWPALLDAGTECRTLAWRHWKAFIETPFHPPLFSVTVSVVLRGHSFVLKYWLRNYLIISQGKAQICLFSSNLTSLSHHLVLRSLRRYHSYSFWKTQFSYCHHTTHPWPYEMERCVDVDANLHTGIYRHGSLSLYLSYVYLPTPEIH